VDDASSVLVDDREPAAVLDAVRQHPNVDVDRLAAADIGVGAVGVERKTLRDYVNGVAARSGPMLEAQVEKMCGAYNHAYVLLEGDLRDVETVPTGVSPAAIRGSMSSITAPRDVPVIPCSDLELLVDTAVRLGRKHTEHPSRRPMSPRAVTNRSEPTTKRINGCIEGIRPALTASLYERYPSVEALLAADTDELLAVDGIGEKRARAIQATLGAEENRLGDRQSSVDSPSWPRCQIRETDVPVGERWETSSIVIVMQPESSNVYNGFRLGAFES
jgi:ERCC4-type nuclease